MEKRVSRVTLDQLSVLICSSNTDLLAVSWTCRTPPAETFYTCFSFACTVWLFHLFIIFAHLLPCQMTVEMSKISTMWEFTVCGENKLQVNKGWSIEWQLQFLGFKIVVAQTRWCWSWWEVVGLKICYLFIYFYRLIYLKEWFTPQMTTMTRAKPGQGRSQELCLILQVGGKGSGSWTSFAAFPSVLTGMWIGNWEAGSRTCTLPAPQCQPLRMYLEGRISSIHSHSQGFGVRDHKNRIAVFLNVE